MVLACQEALLFSEAPPISNEVTSAETRFLGARQAARTRLFSALSILAIVAVAQFVALSNQLTTQRNQTQVINIAGRQRMLAAQAADLADQLVDAADNDQRREYRNWLREDLDELTNNQRRLEDRHNDLNARGWPPAEVSELYHTGPYDVARSTRKFVRHGLSLIAAPANRLTRSNEDLFYLRDMSGSLVYSYDVVVRAYVASAEHRYDILLMYEALGLAALLLTLVLEVPLIFIPMQRAVNNSYRRLMREADSLLRAQKTARLGSWERSLATGEGWWSQQLREMAGLVDGEATPPFGSFNHPDDAAAVQEAVNRARRDDVPYSIEHRIITRAGKTLWIQHQGELTYGSDGRPTSMFGTAFDINERKLAEEQVEYAACFDAVTGLPNRMLLEDRLNQALASARRSAGIVALLSINLDRFKIITDSLGNLAGDHTLQAVSTRLKSLLRESDTVARVGGHEFAIVLSELNDGDSIGGIADKVITACALPYLIDTEEVYTTASIGIGLFPLDASESEELIRVASAAMYKAMDYPGGSYQVSAPEAHSDSFNRLSLERELRRAIERGELVLDYQPIVGMPGQVVGVEALIRWQHPLRGLTSPDIFLPLAEETGLIIPIGDWVLRTACAQAALWQRFRLPEFRIAVNISAVQFRSRKFLESVRDALASSGLPPSALELEITESIVMYDVDAAIETMRSIKDIGVALSVDDFGTGYSSLSYLKQFPIDTLKIDRSFVCGLPANRDDGAIVQAVLTLARNMGLRVVAEGVETNEQVAYLRSLECGQLQGYYFSRPLAAAAMERWILADIEPISAMS